MKYVERTILFAFCLIAVSAFSWALALNLTRLFDENGWRPLTASDWGTWIGAVGTVGTLIGTILLATAESRRRATMELRLARVHASAITLELARISGLLNDPVSHLEKAVVGNLSDTPFEDCVFLLRKIEPVPLERIVPLVALPGNAATLIAQALDSLAGLPLSIERAMTTTRWENHEVRKEFAQKTIYTIRAQQHFLDQGMEQCHAAGQALLLEG